MGFSQHKNGRKSCQKVAGIRTQSTLEPGEKEQIQTSFLWTAVPTLYKKKVSDSITQVWGLSTPNIWIFGRALSTPGCCTPHLDVCRHLSAVLTLERGAPGQASTSLEGPQTLSLRTAHTWAGDGRPALSFSRLWTAPHLGPGPDSLHVLAMLIDYEEQ